MVQHDPDFFKILHPIWSMNRKYLINNELIKKSYRFIQTNVEKEDFRDRPVIGVI